MIICEYKNACNYHLKYNNFNLYSNLVAFILDMPNNRLYGTVPNSMAGSYILRLTCKDSYSQITYQDFTLSFSGNYN